ncbi:MAG: chromosome segregation protein SMC [Clostridiales bacterium]|nr:chromosome segregation protein SMC [Clostridiales bacterium]
MRLTRIEINGFKSFAKKQELTFPEGITAIIGPNGCGKSNIADAFRFVLGEQSAKALRGKKVEDFIFGGTQKRRPLSFCEVSLFFDNTDGELKTPYQEVCITRRAYRSGESEYFINRASCRLKDIHELFRDTGVGKDGYSIIGQGKVSDIISEKSSERRIAFEEAAGVMKYRARKEEAERKLLNTQKNLVRLDDILIELEGRIEPLREQSEKAIKYLKLRDELKDIDVNLYIYQYERSGERIKQLSASSEQLRDEITLAEGSAEALASTLSEGEENERSISAAISEVSQKLLNATAAMESHSGEEKVLNERISSLEKERERLIAESASAKQGIDERKASIAELQKSIASFAAEVEQAEKELEKTELALNECEAELSGKEEELEGHKQSMMDRINRLSDAKSRLSRLDEMKNALFRRIDAIAIEKQAVVDEGEKLRKENAECEASENELGAELTELREKNASAVSEVNRINQTIFTERQREHRLDNELESVRSRSKVLFEMKRAHEGFYSSVRDLLRDAERDTALSSLIEGVVAELISVPAEYETAIEMALGSSLQNIVVPTEQEAKKVIEYLRSKKYGRATFLPVSAMRPRLLTQEERSYINVEGCFGVASELISFSPRYRGVAENLLGRTVIVRDLDVGIAINKRARSSFRIATLQGDIMNPGGSMTGGSAQKREFSLLGREREIEQLKSRAEAIGQEKKKAGENADKLIKDLEAANEKVSLIADEIKKLDIKRASLKEKHDIVLQYVEKNDRQIERYDAELSQINDNISDIEEQSRAASELETGLNSGNASTAEDIKRVQSEITVLKARQQSVSDELTSLKIAHVAAKKEHTAAANELARIEKELDELTASTAKNKESSGSLTVEISECRSRLAEMSKGISGERTQVDSLTDEMRSLEEERAAKLRYVDELRERRDRGSAELNEMRERLHKYELNISRLQIELDNMTSRIWQDYELTYENALAFRHPIQVTASHLRADELRTKIRSLGEVNTSSVEDYRNVVERHTQLQAQCEDLKKAESDLEEIIKRLTATMEREFAEQFKQIQENFSSTFTELFHGGRAELILSDKNDILNCDIDIIAQPPGKKLQLLSLLSGGEQALTAIALLFAILKLKPTAFCILDEIDTSLDEANVDNYAEYLKSYSADTQFIIITHRKGAMAVCDSLYGVSMEEKGVSTLISARFEGGATA